MFPSITVRHSTINIPFVPRENSQIKQQYIMLIKMLTFQRNPLKLNKLIEI